jgi:hypothetical protein
MTFDDNLRAWANAMRKHVKQPGNKRPPIRAPFNKYSNTNLAEANAGMRMNRGGLFVVNGKLYNSQSAKMIPTRANLENNFFSWIPSTNAININRVLNNIHGSLNWYNKPYNNRYGNISKYSNSSKPSTLELINTYVPMVKQKKKKKAAKKMTVAALRARAANRGIRIPSRAKKANILALLRKK